MDECYYLMNLRIAEILYDDITTSEIETTLEVNLVVCRQAISYQPVPRNEELNTMKEFLTSLH